MKLKISKGDTVQVISGAQKGAKGTVQDVNERKMRIRVQGVAMKTHFDKQEGILEKEGYIHYSNVKLVEKAKPGANKTKSARK